MDFPVVLVRFSEIALKSKYTRTMLRRMLRHNILAALKIKAAQFDKIEDTWERLIVHTSESERVGEIASRVFGVASTSPAVECLPEIDAISRVVCDIAQNTLVQGESFAIRVRRVGKHKFTTNEVAVACGSAVIEALRKKGVDVRVDLESPNHEFFVEVRGERTFVFCSITRGVGGLPLGSQGTIVSHLSDAESILATWLMMKRGCSPILVFFASDEDSSGLISLARSSLFQYALGQLPILELPLGELVGQTGPRIPIEFLEYLAMSELVSLRNAEGIVTSKRINPSLASDMEMAKESASIVTVPVFYPLVGFDDGYLMQLAEKIGGSELSSRIQIKRQGLQKSESQAPQARATQSFVNQNRERIRNAVLAALERVQSQPRVN